ncbi:Exopolysaccharide biosynthesis protein [Paenibacillus sp. UNCCL117]|uniref:phosphodiester glycosidase family protein n=1 Tax=unclassified Paenibacillus TaxID=185978 RepID=UPI00088B2811|nr:MULTISPECIES: phosphodiester glycosidase family protein [unclassified Paenibacillus]SDC19526.1 Exopolysaccharide biosynthesis protein [Paenibacillus sp. cl123]SFW18423.1 Exopolysaccharide biosynthesis protein [Paenibacillus sp. UNCCL117]
MSSRVPSNTGVQAKPLVSRPKKSARKRRSSALLTLFYYTVFFLLLFGTAFSCWFFLTKPGSDLRFMMADTLITTQHRHWAQYLIGQEELEKRVNRYWAQFDVYSEVKDKEELVNVEEKPAAVVQAQKPAIEIEDIQGTNFKGKLLIVHDPKMLRIAVPGTAGKGEKVSSMVKRLGAKAGVNAGGFVDPEWKGNGFQPTGLVMSGGKIFYNDGSMNTSNHIVGIDKEGRMVAGKYTPKQLMDMGVQEAVTFAPKFIVNGVGMIKNQADGWGIAPRTAMAQKADGTIMFAIIDGRQPAHSIGATLYDIQNIFLEHGAVTAANLDGGSSSVLVVDDKIVNKPSSEYGERYLPTAWLVFEEPENARITNIWQGLDPAKIDPSKW